MNFSFEISKTDPTGARRGRLTTPHGTVETPFFMPVGTQASVKALTQEALEELGAEIILANTSHLDGTEHLLTPEKAAEIQLALGADVAMVLDECIETPAPRENAEAALKRTTEWAKRARAYFLAQAAHNGDLPQWQFGIVQGATFADLRRESARQLLDLDFPGYAVGGLAVGEPHETTCEMTAEVTALLPKERLRYLMGVGRPEQIADYVALGIDMMDCVLPTRAARHACLYTSEGRVLIKNTRYAQDQRPIGPKCACSVCRRYSRAYLRHLFAAGELTSAILATHHNVL